MQSTTSMDQRMVNVVKGLIMDAIRKANSGHPGGAFSSADFCSVLYKDVLRFDPDDAAWFNRDRFVLSAGHESMLQYALLCLRGLLAIEDLKNFRQLGSRTPGHPEIGVAPGVECTTGPLGQGFSMAVGMAAGEAFLRGRLGPDIVDHHTYVLASDGDMQAPVAQGAAALAGVWGLGKLVVFYDSNKVQLSGPVSRVDCTDYKKVFEGFCWNVVEIDGHDHEAIRKALADAKLEASRPTLIIGHTVMAKGTATSEGDHNTHGAPLSPEEIAATKKKLGLPENEFFHLPQDVLDHFRAGFDARREQAAAWRAALDKRLAADPEAAAFWKLINTPRTGLAVDWPEFAPGEKIATRKAWGACLDAIAPQLPNLVGGSADLDPSNQTAKFRECYGNFTAAESVCRNLAFGVREFAMGAILNGLALHGGVIPFGATFLTFSDYCRSALRMSALQKLPVLYVFTHDSFYVGEDGPTHQPVEHTSSLRLIPDMQVFRPADATETVLCLKAALATPDKPSCLLLTRQGLPVMDPATLPASAEGAAKGGYVLSDPEDGAPEIIVMATGSEVSLALEAKALLPDMKIRVVSLPCVEIFKQQPAAYRDQVLPPAVRKRVAVEAGVPGPWGEFTGLDGLAIGMETFGDSAPSGELAKKYGFTPEAVAERIRAAFA